MREPEMASITAISQAGRELIQIVGKSGSNFPKTPREFSSNKSKNANGLFKEPC